MNNNPFDDGPKKSDGPKTIGLAVPAPLSSAELEAKYGGMKHDSIEILWPTLFEGADGHLEPLTPHDLVALKFLGVTPEEFYLVELDDAP